MSFLLLSLLSRQISAMMMSDTTERGAPSTGPSNGWNDDDDGHSNDADADGSYGSHVPGMGRRLAWYSGPVEQPAFAPRANHWASAPQPEATRSSQTLARLANRKCVALARFSSQIATATRCVHSDPDELAAVRCCGSAGSCYSVCGSPNGLARAVRNITDPRAAPFMLDEVTCGIDGRLSTRAEASAECLAQGLQLCTLAEYKGCRRKGCHYDATWAWVQDECPACTRGVSSQTRSRAPPARNCDGRNRLGGTAAAFYCAHGHEPHGIFCNRCDLDMQNEVLRAATAATAAAEPLHVFAVGTFDGADLERTARQPWFDSGRSTLHGWELQPRVYSAARRRMRALPETIASRVRLTNAAVGAESAILQFVESNGQTAHVQKMSRTDGRKAHDRTPIPSVSWADEAAARSVREVTYALVDVEGHEVPAIQGMRLETNAAVFPVVQYELAGTWVDERHATNWTQYDLALYLERLGYKLFLIGMREDVAKVDRTVLLPLTASSYRDTAWCQLGKKHPRGLHYGDSADCCTLNLEGNMLAVHVGALASKQWLVDLIAVLSLV